VAAIKTYNPVAKSVDKTVAKAPRPTTLDGKRIGLYWNMKSGGDHALTRVEELLTERYRDMSFQRFQGASGGIIRMVTKDQADQIGREVDVVVGTTAD
jgi:hypothetical protein